MATQRLPSAQLSFAGRQGTQVLLTVSQRGAAEFVQSLSPAQGVGAAPALPPCPALPAVPALPPAFMPDAPEEPAVPPAAMPAAPPALLGLPPLALL
jgi:hypothetical protein